MCMYSLFILREGSQGPYPYLTSNYTAFKYIYIYKYVNIYVYIYIYIYTYI
jgi:hypothetical protein